MKKSKITVDGGILDKITVSTELSDLEKIHFMKYIGYMTNSEKKELVEII